MSQIAAALNITRSQCYAILKTLQAENFVSFDVEQKTYNLGLALVEMGHAVSRELSILAIARPFLADYVKRSNLSVFLISRLDTHRLIVLDKAEPPADIRITISIGTTTRITRGASGMCFLAFLPPDERDELLQGDLAELRPDLEKYREEGYAVSFEQSMVGTNAVAAPIFNREGRIEFALTIVGFTSSLQRSRIKTVGRELRALADAITTRSGGVMPASTQARLVSRA